MHGARGTGAPVTGAPATGTPGTRPTTGRRGAALLVACLLGLLGVSVGAVPAQAAAGSLVVSEPEGRAVLSRAPGWVTLAFDGKVDDSVAKVVVLDAGGANVTAGPLVVEDTNVTTQLEDDLPKGTYTVHYRVNGSGGEPRGGAFQFSYGSGSFSDPADKSWSGSANEPEVLRGSDPNGPEPPVSTDSPGVEVTSTEQPTEPTRTSRQTSTETATDDPDDPGADRTVAGEDPQRSATERGVPAQSDTTGRVFLIGGLILLAAVVGTVVGVYRARRKGEHS